jgi:type II secretory pathway pseudopilin PulG
MWNDFFNSLSLIDFSGYLIIVMILVSLIIAVAVNLAVRGRYALLEKELNQHTRSGKPFRNRVLVRIVRDAEESFGSFSAEPNFQALIEHHFKKGLAGSFLAERFLKSAAGLMIVLGLVGTFYGLTLSIGKLVTLITGDVSGVAEITESLTKGLAGALSGMSVAFSTSLVGILASIAVILLRIFSNLADRRVGLMLRLEVYLDERRREALESDTVALGKGSGKSVGLPSDLRTVQAIENLGVTVATLQESMATFDASLKEFSSNTRNFQEFNLHLKDNIQRMSLGFADLSETLKSHVAQLKSNWVR